MSIYPDNYFYYIIFFTISVLIGVYLIFSYNRSRLLYLNAIMFFLVAIRFSTEYYLPQVESFKIATNIAIFHHLVVTVVSFLLKYCAWFYIRPFKNSRWEKLANNIYLWGILVIPYFIMRGYIIFERKLYSFQPEKMDGYWRFAADKTHFLFDAQNFHSVLTYYILIAVLLWSLWKDKNYRFKKSLLFISFIVIPYIIKKYFFGQLYNTPNTAIFFFWNTFLITWFVSEYHLIIDSFDEVRKDLLNSISDLAITTDLQLNITHTNNQAKQLFNIKGQPFTELLATHSTASTHGMKEIVENIIKNKYQKQELSLDLEEKGKRIFSIKAAPLKQGSRIMGHTFLLTDLTEIREKEKQLEQSNTTKDRLFAIIGHDLRKPALAFRGISKKVNFLIQQKEFDTLNKLGQNLELAAFSLNSLLDNLLNWALNQRDVLPYDPKPVNVQHATEEIFQLLGQIANEKGVSLQLNIAEATHAYSDPNALTTIIRNLVDNAIKYTPEGGVVAVNSKRKDADILITVTDTGIGMTTEQLAKVFILDKNKSTQGTQGEKGSGLGLTLVKDLVILNKGKIKVDSQPSKGTTFELLFPAA